MTHEDSGKYAKKHPPGTTLNEQIAEMIRVKSTGDGLGCASAEEISQEFGVKMSEVGLAADLLEIKIIWCQLGTF